MMQQNSPFFLFGMGTRDKFLYKSGQLFCIGQTRPILQWAVTQEIIIPDQYRVELTTAEGMPIVIFEDENAVTLLSGGEKVLLSEGTLVLPDFADNRYARVLRVLHQEMLFHISGGKPLPNLFVYKTPWYRDAAMVAMCLQKTGNLPLIRDWILSLDKPYDQNNAGNCEPDNLGQALYLISTVSDAGHPLVSAILQEAQRICKNGHLCGLSDFAPHPVYQTKWLKFGLKQLGLPDPYTVPACADSYDALFWFDYQDMHCPCLEFDDNTVRLYPYLGWAQAHFYHKAPPMELLSSTYPFTWECEASQADYTAVDILSGSYSESRYSPSHTWHAAEAFLYLLSLGADKHNT